MRSIAEGFILGKAATAELWILNCAGDIAISINKIHSSGNANRSTIGIDKDLCVIAHVLTDGLSRDNREAPANVKGDVAST